MEPKGKLTNHNKHKIDSLLLFVTLVLVSIGLIMVLSSSSYDGLINHEKPTFYFTKQFVFGLFGVGAMLWISTFPIGLFKRLSPVFAVIMVLVMIFTMLAGVEINGSRRWLKISGFQFSPAEIAKPIYVVAYAYLLAAIGKKRLKMLRWFLVAAAVLLVMVGPIVKEDLGTGVIVFSTLFSMLMVAGAKPIHLIALTLLAVLGGTGAVILNPYRLDRIHYWLRPFDDPLHKGYQAVQSFYAIGSGGLFGVGLGAGIQKLLILPEQQTDMIFSVIAEEMGFIGAGFVVLLFAVFLWRGILIAFHLEDKFKRLCAFGLTIYIVVQATINIAVTVGWFPITGVPLPFISYGGTSFVLVIATVGLLLGLSRYTTEDKKRKKTTKE